MENKKNLGLLYRNSLLKTIENSDLERFYQVIDILQKEQRIAEVMTPDFFTQLTIKSSLLRDKELSVYNDMVCIVIDYVYETNRSDINRVDVFSTTGSVLDWALEWSTITVLNALLKYNPTTEIKNIALFNAARFYKYAKAKQLLKQGADVNVASPKGTHILLFAAKLPPLRNTKEGQQKLKETLAFIEALIDEFKIDPNKTNNKGETALMHAAASHSAIIEKLIEKGANKDLTDKQGNTALMLYNHYYGRDLDDLDGNDSDYGNNLYDFYEFDEDDRCFIQSNIKLLVNLRANVNLKNKAGHTALVYAINNLHIIAVVWMLPLSDENNIQILLKHLGEHPALRKAFLKKFLTTYDGKFEMVDSEELTGKKSLRSWVLFFTSKQVKTFFKKINSEPVKYPTGFARFLHKQACLITGYFRENNSKVYDPKIHAPLVVRMISQFTLGYPASQALKTVVDHQETSLVRVDNDDTAGQHYTSISEDIDEYRSPG